MAEEAGASLILNPPQKTEPFVGAIYEKPDPMSFANREAEMAVIHLAMTADGLCGDLLHRLQPEDFFYSDCLFLFVELLTMADAREPVTDKAAQLAWFRRPEVVARMDRPDLASWFEVIDGEKHPRAATAIFELVLNGAFASLANLDWYVLELRRCRLMRGFRKLAYRVIEQVDRQSWTYILGYLEGGLAQLKEIAETIKQPERKQPESKSEVAA